MSGGRSLLFRGLGQQLGLEVSRRAFGRRVLGPPKAGNCRRLPATPGGCGGSAPREPQGAGEACRPRPLETAGEPLAGRAERSG